MLIQFLPAIIMFAITVAFVTLFFVPAAVFPQKNELINFYWVGIWIFLGMIAALSGGGQTLRVLNYDATLMSESVLFAVTLCFVIFVIFAWFRLSFTALKAGWAHVMKRFA